MLTSLADRPKADALRMSHLVLTATFVAYLGIFMFTVFPAPVSQGVIQRLRWPVLVGTALVFFLLRKHSVRSFPLMLLAYYFVALLSSCMAEGYLFALSKFFAMSFSLALSFYLIPAALNPAQFRKIIATACCVICAFGAASLSMGVLSGRVFSLKRYESLFFGINSEGAYMGFTFFAALWMWAEYPKSRFRMAFQLLVPASLVGCYATGSRSSFFGLMVGSAVWALTLFVRGQTRRRRQFFIFMFILACIVISKRGFFERGWESLMRESETSEDFFESRMWIWEDSWRAFKEKPFLGHGYGVSAMVTEEKEVSLKSTVSVRDGSGYMGLLESLGILGCGAFGLLVLQLVLSELILLRQKVINPNALTAHGMSSMTAFLLVNHIGEPWLLGPGGPTFHLFWFFMGAAFHFNHLARNEEKARKQAILMAKLAASRALWQEKQSIHRVSPSVSH